MVSTRCRWIFVLGAALLLAGCPKPNQWKLVSKMDLSTPTGDPKITTVEDLGSVPLIENKPLMHDKSDGIAVVGELLVIRGTNLGKQPQVTFGTKPMAVLARTEDGGIVVRAPSGTTPGKLNITVSHDRGSASYPMELKRYGLAVIPGLTGLQVFEVTATGIKLSKQPLLAAAPRFVELDRYGSVAYAATSGKNPRFIAIDLAAAGGPKIVYERALALAKVIGLSTASESKWAVVVDEKSLAMFYLDDARKPEIILPATRFPTGVLKQGVVDLKLSPDGKTLVALVAKKNALVLFDVSDPSAKVRNTTYIPLLPEAKEPLVRSLHFTYEPRSKIKQVLWIATGDTLRSQLVGKHPPTLLKYGIVSATDRATLPKATSQGTVPLPGQRTPLVVKSSYAVSQIASASAIRRETSRMTFFMTMMHPDLFLLKKQRLDTPTGLQQGAELLRRLGKYGTILRTDHQGRGGVFHQAPGLFSELVITGDGAYVLAVGCKPRVSVDPLRVEVPCGLLVKPTDKRPPSFLSLGKLPRGAFKPPFSMGTVRVQP